MGSSNDDVSEDVECDGGVLDFGGFYSNSGGNAFYTLSRLLAFFILFGFNYYNKLLLQRKLDNAHVVKGLILPFYFHFIYMYLALTLLTGLLNLIVQYGFHNPYNILVFIMPVETGLSHCLYEGLAFYLIRHGAGLNAIYRALAQGLVFGLFTTVVWFFIFGEKHYAEYNIHTHQPHKIVYSIYVSYQILLLLFYSLFIVVPINYLYRRPAMDIYAPWNIMWTVLCIIFSSLVYTRQSDAYCPAVGIMFICTSFVQPLIIFLTLRKDSQYWQGLANPGPMSKVWDMLDLQTADSIAHQHDVFHRDGNVPVVHFGLLKFDENANFVAGGFSRVYFGDYKNEKVAMKVMFAMELTPSDVHEFYREATILANLQHTNVVKCKGVCVMPPMLTLVLEHCQYGSLFDFLYKAADQTAVTELGNIRYRSHVYKDSTTRGSIDGMTIVPDGCVRESSGSVEMPVSLNPMNSNRAMNDHQLESGLTHVNNPIHPNPVLEQTEFWDEPRSSMCSILSGSSTEEDDNTSRTNLTNYNRNLLDAHNNPYGSSSSRLSGYRVDSIGSVSDSELGSVLSDGPRHGGESIGAMSYDSRGKAIEKALPSKTQKKKKTLFAKGKHKLDKIFKSRVAASSRDTKTERPVAHSLLFLQRVQMMRDCVCAIAFLHAKGYLHCDVKSLNFLVTLDFRVKLADMGESRLQTAPPKSPDPPRPAKNWCPPEVLKQGATALDYTSQSDIYGLAIVLAELVLLELPFGDLPNLMITKDWLHVLTVEKRRPDLPPFVAPRLRSSIEQAWQTDPKLRPTAAVMLEEIDSALKQLRSMNVV